MIWWILLIQTITICFLMVHFLDKSIKILEVIFKLSRNKFFLLVKKKLQNKYKKVCQKIYLNILRLKIINLWCCLRKINMENIKLWRARNNFQKRPKRDKNKKYLYKFKYVKIPNKLLKTLFSQIELSINQCIVLF